MLSLESPTRLMIQAVMVVPILEPMMMPTVLLIFMSPEFTRPTSMTVTAEELCMAMVMTQPIRSPITRFRVVRLIMDSSRLPAIFSRLCDIWFMP